MRKLRVLAASVFAALTIAVAAPAAHADFQFCGPSAPNNGPGEECHTVYTAGDHGYLHIGNAEDFLAYHYLQGTGSDMNSWCRNALGTWGQNMAASPTIWYSRYSALDVIVYVHWDDYYNHPLGQHRYCQWGVRIGGSDGGDKGLLGTIDAKTGYY